MCPNLDANLVSNKLGVFTNLCKHLGADCALALLTIIFVYYGLQLCYRIVLYVAFGS